MQKLSLQEFVLCVRIANSEQQTNAQPRLPPGNIGVVIIVEELRSDAVVDSRCELEVASCVVEGRKHVLVDHEWRLFSFLLDRVNVLVQPRRVVRSAELQHRRLDKLRCDERPHACDGSVVVEPRITESAHPVERVVVAVIVIDRVLRSVAKAHVDGGDAGEVLEGGEVGSGAHGGDALVPGVEDRLARDGLIGGFDEGKDFLDDFAEKGCSGELVEGTARAHIDVEVGDCGSREPGEVFFDPFGAAD